MVFVAVTSDGKVMPPHFIEEGLKVLENSKRCFDAVDT